MRAAVEEFLVVMAPRYARSSLNIHRYGLGKLVEFAAEREPVDFQEAQFALFHQWLCEQRLSEKSINTILRSAKQFFRWAYQTQRTLFDVERYSLPAQRQVWISPPTVEVMCRLLELPDLSTARGLRDRTALELLYVLGLRRNECASLDLGDLNLERGTVFISGKGGEQRLLPLSRGLRETLLLYLERGRPELVQQAGEQALLLTLRGGRLHGGLLYHLVRSHGKALGLELSVHQLRRACATHLIEAGMDFAQVQHLLGHRCPKSTQHYAQIRPSELHKEFAAVHPRAAEASCD